MIRHPRLWGESSNCIQSRFFNFSSYCLMSVEFKNKRKKVTAIMIHQGDLTEISEESNHGKFSL